jgi:arginine/lysine/ornithine decarboxylase
MLPRDAFFARVENVKAKDAEGRICAELVTPYPPGIPVLAPGEEITEPILRYLEEIVAAGAFVEGASDQSLDTFRVVAR